MQVSGVALPHEQAGQHVSARALKQPPGSRTSSASPAISERSDAFKYSYLCS